MIPLLLRNWKLVGWGLSVAVMGALLFIARGDARHWRKQDAQHVAALNLEIAKNAVNLASIDQLTAALAAKNAESEARAKALSAAKEDDARNRAAFDKQEAATDARVKALEAISRLPGGNVACRAPKALTDALEGL